jgi:hypothetical protein
MNRTNVKSAGKITSINATSSASASIAPDDRDCYEAEHAAELKAKRVVNTVATLRILVPVALITAIVMSGRLPEVRIDNAMATIAETPAVSNAAAHYFPAQFVNQGAGGEEHVPNF